MNTARAALLALAYDDAESYQGEGLRRSIPPQGDISVVVSLPRTMSEQAPRLPARRGRRRDDPLQADRGRADRGSSRATRLPGAHCDGSFGLVRAGV